MKVWITKFALTSGILEKEAEICHSINDEMIKITTDHNGLGEYYHGKDWHKTREEAVIQANDMVARKIQTVEKQLNKLKATKF